MNLWIDCEWNDYRGDLISMALVSRADDQWYQVLPCESPTPWVQQHVIPVLGAKEPITLPEMQESLQRFLAGYETVHIIADWPEDIERFCRLLIVGPGMRLNTPPLTMEVLRIDSESRVPHNALADAIGFRDHYLREK